MSFIKQLCFALALASVSSLGCAQTMFKCQTNGKISYQADPCADNSAQQVMQANERGDVKFVQTHRMKAADPNAPRPTGARTGDAENPDMVMHSDRFEKRKEMEVVQPHSAAAANPDAPRSTGARADDVASPDKIAQSDRSDASEQEEVTNSDASAPAPLQNKPGEPGLPPIVWLYLFVVCVLSSVWFLVIAFRESFLWGVLCLFVPLANLVFLVMFWKKAKNPFLFSIGMPAILGIIWAIVYGRPYVHSS